MLFQAMKSISLGNKMQKGDIIKHNESQKQKWVMFSFSWNETSQDYSRGPICLQPTQQNALYSSPFETKTFKHSRKQISSQWFYQ